MSLSNNLYLGNARELIINKTETGYYVSAQADEGYVSLFVIGAGENSIKLHLDMRDPEEKQSETSF